MPSLRDPGPRGEWRKVNIRETYWRLHQDFKVSDPKLHMETRKRNLRRALMHGCAKMRGVMGLEQMYNQLGTYFAFSPPDLVGLSPPNPKRYIHE